MRLRRGFVLVLALVAIVFGLAVISGFHLYQGALSEQESQALDNTAETTATQIDALIEERQRTVRFQAADPAVRGPAEQRRDTLQRFVEHTEFQGVSVIDADGEMVAIESKTLTEDERSSLVGADFSERTYYKEAMDGSGYVSEPIAAETGNLIVTISQPIESDGEIVGTLNGALHVGDPSFFAPLAPADEIDHEVTITAGELSLFQSTENEEPRKRETTAESETTNWVVTAVQPRSGTGHTQIATIFQFGAGALVLVTLVGFAAWFQRSNLRQIDELLDGLDRLANREYGTEIDVSGAKEWEQIESRFNAVSSELATHERELKRYREIVERVDDPIILHDCDGNFELVNRAITELTGLSRETLIGGDESLYMDDETAAFVAERRAEVLETERSVEFTFSVTPQDSSDPQIHSARCYPYYDGTGSLSGTLTICRDITDTKERETELRQYKKAVNGATDLICAVDENREYLFANPQYCTYHGLDPDTLTEVETNDVFDQQTYDDINEYTKRALNGETVKYKMNRVHPTKGERILDVRYYPLGEGSEVTGFVAVLRDVTEREERARQLRVVDRVLRHNLRNDLTVISLEAERISSGSNGTLRDAADAIQKHADGLLTTSDKSRNITEVLSDDPEMRSIAVTDIVRSVANDVESEHPRVSIDSEISGEVAVESTTYLHDAIDELVRNAVDHSDRDSPTVEIRVQQSDGTVTIEVGDDGPGIPKMDRDVLETGRAIEDLYHGSGLGLWMVYWVVQRSGGSIDVRDRSPRGTVVEITLPKAHTDE